MTVSLDALDDDTFRAMNDVDFPVAKVLEAIDAASAAGFRRSRSTWWSSAASTSTRSCRWRAISAAAATCSASSSTWTSATPTAGSWTPSCSAAEILRTIDAEAPIEAIDANYPGEVAERWRYRDGSGEIGVIASVTQAFCRDCTRLRLSTDGKIYTCLFATDGVDLRALLRGGASDAAIAHAIAMVWRARRDRYSDLRSAASVALPKVEMSYIGG